MTTDPNCRYARDHSRGAFLARTLFRVLLMLALLTACASLTWPFGWDQGIFAWVGDVIVHGGLPYRDGWDIKGPLVYYLYAIAQWLFGPHPWSIRLLDIALLALACPALLRVVGAWTNRAVAAWATLLFCLWYASGSYWHTAQPDGWVMMLMIPVGSWLLQPKPESRGVYWWSSGLLIGATVLVKFFYAGFLLIPMIAALTAPSPWRSRLPNLLRMLAGSTVPPLIVILGFWQLGALDSLVEATLWYPSDTYSTLLDAGIESRMRGLIEYLSSGLVIAVVLPFVLLGLVVSALQAPRLAGGLFSWIGVAAALAMLQNRFFTYHMAPLIPPVVISASIGMHALFEALNSADPKTQSLRRRLMGSLLCVLAFHVSPLPAYEVLHWAAYLARPSNADQYFAHFGEAADDIAMAKVLEETTNPEERIVIFGWNSAILFLSRRMSPTRFGFSMPLLQGNAKSRWFTRYRREFMEAICARPPSAIVVGTQSRQLLGGDYTLADFPELADFVARFYMPQDSVGDLQLYRYRNDAPRNETRNRTVSASPPCTAPPPE